MDSKLLKGENDRSKENFELISLQAAALKIAATRAGQHDYGVVEHALLAYLGMELLPRTEKNPPLSERQAMKLAYDELHRCRTR
jgi:hypothetical protein